MTNNLNPKQLLHHITTHPHLSIDQQLTLYTTALDTNLPADIYSLQFWLNYIELLIESDEDESFIRHIFKLQSVNFGIYLEFWKRYVEFEIRVGGDVRMLVGKSVGRLRNTWVEKRKIEEYFGSVLGSLRDGDSDDNVRENLNGDKVEDIGKNCDDNYDEILDEPNYVMDEELLAENNRFDFNTDMALNTKRSEYDTNPNLYNKEFSGISTKRTMIKDNVPTEHNKAYSNDHIKHFKDQDIKQQDPELINNGSFICNSHSASIIEMEGYKFGNVNRKFSDDIYRIANLSIEENLLTEQKVTRFDNENSLTNRRKYIYTKQNMIKKEKEDSLIDKYNNIINKNTESDPILDKKLNVNSDMYNKKHNIENKLSDKLTCQNQDKQQNKFIGTYISTAKYNHSDVKFNTTSQINIRRTITQFPDNNKKEDVTNNKRTHEVANIKNIEENKYFSPLNTIKRIPKIEVETKEEVQINNEEDTYKRLKEEWNKQYKKKSLTSCNIENITNRNTLNNAQKYNLNINLLDKNTVNKYNVNDRSKYNTDNDHKNYLDYKYENEDYDKAVSTSTRSTIQNTLYPTYNTKTNNIKNTTLKTPISLVTNTHPTKDTVNKKTYKAVCNIDPDEYQNDLTYQMNKILKTIPKKEIRKSKKVEIQDNKSSPQKSENIDESTESEVIIKPKQKDTANIIYIKDKKVEKLHLIGRGGSCKVYRALCEGKFCALKMVRLEGESESVSQGYENEIKFLEKFKGCKEIIDLYSFEKKNKYLYLLMEHGESDLASLLKSTREDKLSLNCIKDLWEQMLKIMKKVHSEKIIHRDLKPANFLIVKGRLKLIDFGISKAIIGETTNYRTASMMGTINYMSPESLGSKKKKVGRSSDIWSLGCILYEMVYGRSILHHIDGIGEKVAELQNKHFAINFDDVGYEYRHAIKCIRRCFVWDSDERATLDELLSDRFLNMQNRHIVAVDELRILVKRVLGMPKNHDVDRMSLVDTIVEKFIQNLDSK